MFLNTKVDKSHIYGYSMSRHNSIFTILTRTASDYQIKQLKIPKEQKWAGMELTTIGDLMIVANACKKSKPVKTEFMRMMASKM